MTAPKEPWMKFEAIKTSMRQDGKGTYMVLTIHPDEVPIDLLAARPGSRYMVGMVQVDDHDQTVKGRDMDEGDRAVQSAGMLCRNPKFQKWMVQNGLALESRRANAPKPSKPIAAWLVALSFVMTAMPGRHSLS